MMRILETMGIILLFTLLLVVCTFTGCIQESSIPQQSSLRQDSGFRDITDLTGGYPVSLEEALESMRTTKNSEGQSLLEYSIHYIEGEEVFMDGAATHWMIGLKKGNTRLFYHYDSESSSLVPWSAWLPQDPIDLDQVMMPSCLISTEPKISSLFADQESLKSIELVKTTYTVNIETNGMVSSQEYSALLRGPCPTQLKPDERVM